MSRYLPNGIGESLGDTLVTNEPLFTTGDIHYVNSEADGGADSTGFGKSEARPFVTLAYAVTQATAGDIIVVADGHNELVITEIDITVMLLIVGAGQSDGFPTAHFTNYTASGYVMRLSAANSQLRNLKFVAHSAPAAIPQVNVAATGCSIIGCLFDADEDNTAYSVTVNTGLITRIDSCTFESTALDPDDAPTGGLLLSGVGTLFIDNCVFDEGVNGYSSFAFRNTGTYTIVGEGNSFLNGAVLSAVESGSKIVLAGGTMTGGVQWVEE